MRKVHSLVLMFGLALNGACGGSGGTDSAPVAPADHPPGWTTFSWQFRGGYAVLGVAASDPDGTATTVTCTGTVTKTYTNSGSDSVAIAVTTSSQTLQETCNAASNGKSAAEQSGSATAPAGIQLRFSRMDATTRAPLTTGGWSTSVGSRLVTPGADGTASLLIFPGQYQINLLDGVTDAQNYVKYQLDQSVFKGDDSVRVLYLRHPSDSATLNKAMDIVLLQQAKSNTDFDEGHLQAAFDDVVYGMQSIPWTRAQWRRAAPPP